MSARILVVDDTPTNVKLLEARLTAEYFEVLTASSGPQALALCAENLCDIILLDVMMPGMDGLEVCRRLKHDPATAHIPVVMVTALDEPSDRLRGLEAGADDFLTKPVDDLALIARVRSLVRLKTLTDELRNRVLASRGLGIVDDPLAGATLETGRDAQVLVVEDRPETAARMQAALAVDHAVCVVETPAEALARVAEEDFDVFIVSLGLAGADGLRLCSNLRAMERSRNAVVLMVADESQRPAILRGLDIGVHDYLLRPVEHSELVARVRTQVRRKRYADSLRASVQASLALAVLDPLTGLYNRRYLDGKLRTTFTQARESGDSLSLLLLDIDRFKLINDGFGHDVGDEVLREFARRVQTHTRGIDTVCRFGGEEIVVIVPGTPLEAAEAVAERVRMRVEGEPFVVQRGRVALEVTVSIGVASLLPGDGSIQALFKRADMALYRAKAAGRNRVVAAAGEAAAWGA